MNFKQSQNCNSISIASTTALYVPQCYKRCWLFTLLLAANVDRSQMTDACSGTCIWRCTATKDLDMRFVEPERLNIHGMLCRFKCIASSCVDHFGCSMNALGGMLPTLMVAMLGYRSINQGGTASSPETMARYAKN